MKKTTIFLCCCITWFAAPNQAFADDRYRNFEIYEGYKKRPYDKKRHYRHHEHRGYRYNYRGHWRSWDKWNLYLKKHPELRRHGHYYHDGGHLMFRSCPPGTTTCLFFSIGR